MLDLPNIQFSLSAIFLGLDGLNLNPNPGPDGVPEIVLKSSSIFNHSNLYSFKPISY